MSAHDTKWTPGPWLVYEGGNFCLVVPPQFPESSGCLGGAICRLDDWNGEEHRSDNPKVLPNAHLIAAAPELYAALEAARPLLVGALAFVDCNPQLAKLDAALAKARGE